MTAPILQQQQGQYDSSAPGYGEDLESQYKYYAPAQEIGQDVHQQLRMGFIRKVYGILSFQLLLTVGICAVMMLDTSIRDYCLNSWALLYAGVIMSFVTLIPLMCCCRKAYPMNFILLLCFTVCEAIVIGYVCAIYYTLGYGAQIVQALGITTSLFVGLSLFTFQAKIEFTFMRAGVFAFLYVFLMWGLFISFWGFYDYSVYCLFGALLMCLLIVWDTARLCSRYYLNTDEYILASVELYLDFINLFLYILRLLRR